MPENGFPEGKFMAMVKVGAKGQIVIPSEVREMFGIQSGDSLLLLADIQQGIAIPSQEQAKQIMDTITSAMPYGKGRT